MGCIKRRYSAVNCDNKRVVDEYEASTSVDTWACMIDADGTQPSTLLVATDGACPFNGTPKADRMGMGVYFGPENPNNHRWTVFTRKERVSNQRAELLAAIWALRRVHRLREWKLSGGPANAARLTENMDYIENVVLKADSDYVVKCMSVWVNKWRSNDWTNSRGVDVANKDLIMRLDRATTDLEGSGCRVMFWHVPRFANQEADCLADEALKLVDHRPRLG